MASSVVGYTNDTAAKAEVEYTGGSVEEDKDTRLCKSEIRVDQDPTSETYKQIKAYVYDIDDEYLQKASDWDKTDESAVDYIKNKPFEKLDDDTIKNIYGKLQLDPTRKENVDKIPIIETLLDGVIDSYVNAKDITLDENIVVDTNIGHLKAGTTLYKGTNIKDIIISILKSSN